MKLFISWSGDKSLAAAKALSDFVQDVVQAVEPWMSSEGIEKGARWSAAIADKLDETDQGIVVVTKGNQDAPWLNFEAGALAKRTATARVRTVLVDLRPTDVTGPLTAFQHTSITSRSDMLTLVKELNSACDRQVREESITRGFERAWPDFMQVVQGLPEESSGKGERSVQEMVVEVLEVVRGLERATLVSKTRPIQIPGNLPVHLVPSANARPFEFIYESVSNAPAISRDRLVHHKKFGIGRVIETTADDQVLVEFRDKDGRKFLSEVDPNHPTLTWLSWPRSESTSSELQGETPSDSESEGDPA